MHPLRTALLVLLLVPLATVGGQEEPWTLETLSVTGAELQTTALAVSDYGLHVVWFDGARGQLTYGERPHGGTGWRFETVASGGEGSWPALAVDGLTVVVVYQGKGSGEETTLELRQKALPPIDRWSEPVVLDEGSGMRTQPSIAASGGVVHVAFTKAVTVPRGWVSLHYIGGRLGSLEGPMLVNEPASFGSIALNPSGEPEIAFDGSGPTLRYATRTAEGWDVEVVDAENNAGPHADLFIDASAVRHVVYQAGSDNGALRYARGQPGGWTAETVEKRGTPGTYMDLVVDDGGQPHVSYFPTGVREIRYATKQGDTWLLSDVAAAEPGSTRNRGPTLKTGIALLDGVPVLSFVSNNLTEGKGRVHLATLALPIDEAPHEEAVATAAPPVSDLPQPEGGGIPGPSPALFVCALAAALLARRKIRL